MKKNYFILIIFFTLFIIGFFGYSSMSSIGPGTAYQFSVVKGCDDIKENTFVDPYTNELNVSFSDEMLDSIIIKSGFGRRIKESIRELCFINSSLNQNCVDSYFDMTKSFCLRNEDIFDYFN